MNCNHSEFKTYNDWIVCRCAPGAREIVANSDDTISHMTTTRGRSIVGDRACREWLAEHDDARRSFESWLSARSQAVDEWKHRTPHHRYDCERGSIALRVNGVRVLVRNCVGDGNFPVYIMRESGSMNGDAPAPDVLPHTFRLSDTLIESDDQMNVEVLDYDCDGGNSIETFSAKSISFYVDGCGAVVVKFS